MAHSPVLRDTCRARRAVLVTLLVAALCLPMIASAATGPWSGRWQRAAGEYGQGSPVFTLSQHGARVAGAFHWLGCGDQLGGSIAGKVQDGVLVATFRHKNTAGQLRLRLTKHGKAMAGTWKVTGGPCAGGAGPFHATYVGPLR